MVDDNWLRSLTALLAPGGRVIRAWSLNGGSSAEMTGLEIADTDGTVERLVLRRQRTSSANDALATEYQLLQTLVSTPVTAPVPKLFLPAAHGDESSLLVLNFIHGEMDFAPRDLVSYVEQMADALAAIHLIVPPPCFLPSLPPHRVPAPGQPASALNDTRIARALHDAHLPPPGPPALLHGDFWPGNTLWRNQRLVAVIDWEDAALGDRLVDLARSRAEICCIFGIDALSRFTARYAAALAVDAQQLAYWDLLSAQRTARLVGASLPTFIDYFRQRRHPTISVETLRSNFSHFVEQALLHI